MAVNPRQPPGKVLVIGLDGATFDLIGPWAEAGHLPHLARLMAEGAWGPIQSTIPAQSAPAWTTFATGLQPGRHGIYFFLGPSRDSRYFRPVSADSVSGRSFWDLASEQGCRAGVVNVPMTYPPKPIAAGGYVIAGMPSPDVESAFWPPELHEEIVRQFGGYSVEIAVSQNRGQYLDQMLEGMEMRCSVAEHLIEHKPADLFIVVFRMIDSIMHHYWSDMDPHHPLHSKLGKQAIPDAILSGYRTLDGAVGRLLAKAGADTTVFLLSDHGFRAEYWRFAVNKWLRDRGLLALRRGRASLLSGASSLVRRRGVLKVAKRAFRLVAGSDWFQPVVWSSVDWPRTRVVFGPGPALYVNLKGRDYEGVVAPEEYEALRDQLVADLKSVRDPEKGLPIFAEVYRREEIYEGQAVERAPDLVPVPAEYTTDGRRWGYGLEPFPGAPALFGHAGRFAGVHAPEGIFMARGPQIQPGEVPAVHIADMAPTVLYALGLAVPHGLDGQVRTELFDPALVAGHPVRYEDWDLESEGRKGKSMSDEEEDVVQARLRGLGYL